MLQLYVLSMRTLARQHRAALPPNMHSQLRMPPALKATLGTPGGHCHEAGTASFRARIFFMRMSSAVSTMCLHGSAPVPSILKMK